jgi:hypothetical protein
LFCPDILGHLLSMLLCVIPGPTDKEHDAAITYALASLVSCVP